MISGRNSDKIPGDATHLPRELPKRLVRFLGCLLVNSSHFGHGREISGAATSQSIILRTGRNTRKRDVNFCTVNKDTCYDAGKSLRISADVSDVGSNNEEGS